MYLFASGVSAANGLVRHIPAGPPAGTPHTSRGKRKQLQFGTWFRSAGHLKLMQKCRARVIGSHFAMGRSSPDLQLGTFPAGGSRQHFIFASPPPVFELKQKQ